MDSSLPSGIGCQANSGAYWREAPARHDRKAPASARGGRKAKSYRQPICRKPNEHQCTAHFRGRPGEISRLAPGLVVEPATGKTGRPYRGGRTRPQRPCAGFLPKVAPCISSDRQTEPSEISPKKPVRCSTTNDRVLALNVESAHLGRLPAWVRAGDQSGKPVGARGLRIVRSCPHQARAKVGDTGVSS
jgi:hypothetical protein